MQTNFIEIENSKYLINQAIDALNSNYSDIENLISSDLISVNKDTYHFIADLLLKTNQKDSLIKVFHKLLMNTTYRTETLTQDGGVSNFIFSMIFLKKLLKLDKNQLISSKLSLEYDNLLEKKILSKIQKHSKVCSIKDIEKTIDNICDSNHVLSTSIKEAINLAGLEGKILIENGKSSNYIIEQKSGYSFKLNPFKYFFGDKTIDLAWERNKVKVLLVDGLVEKISELDQILQKAYETKQPVAIIACGFSEEVVATLKINQEKQNFDIIPIRINSDLDSLNLINDISIACGTTPISNLKGELLTYVTWDNLVTIDKIRVTTNETIIENETTKAQVSLHVKNLLQKRHEQSVIEDIEILLDKRIKNLVAEAVIINLPNYSVTQNEAERVKIDTALRATKTLLNYGMINLENFKKDFTEDSSNVLESIINESIVEFSKQKNKIPTLALLSVFKVGIPTSILFACSSGFVIKV